MPLHSFTEKKLYEFLTPRQVEACNLRGPTVLIACPGAGKTRIVGARMALLSAEAERKGWAGVAAITFTNAAADEIRSMYRKIVGKDVAAPHYIGTIDSFIFRYVFNPFAHLVLGNPDQAPELVPPKSDRLNTLYRGYKWKALHGVAKESYSYKATGEIRPCSSKPALREAVRNMKEEMWSRNIATIQDAGYFSLATLRARPRLGMILARRFPFIMVDEAQDCSDVQMGIIDELALTGHNEIMLIGDPFQAIYKFREAEPQLLVDKAKDAEWRAHTLPDTHRCRPQLVKLINATVCNTDAAARALRSVCTDVPGAVKIIQESDPEAIAKAFIKECEDEGLTPSIKNSAILYGAHSSNMSREKVERKEIEKLFSSTDRHLHAALPIVQQRILQGRYADALEEATELICWLKHNRSSYELARQKQDMEFVGALRPKLWFFCKRLPNPALKLREWIVQTNVMFKEFLLEHHLAPTFQIQLSRLVGGRKDLAVKTLLIGDGDYATGLPLTVTNVHQVKGRTFESVLVYLEPEPQKMISGARLLKLLSGTKSFAEMKEPDRCTYVAITRAEKLLCFAGDIDGLRKRLDELDRFSPAHKSKVTRCVESE